MESSLDQVNLRRRFIHEEVLSQEFVSLEFI